jgi:hypothetical protein
MKKFTIPRIEFYITNVCNYGCTECNRFNNHKFTGHQRWEDYADVMREWGEYININFAVILGGEPLLNPTVTDWVRGLREIWPYDHTGKNPEGGHGFQLLTNGSRLSQVKGLYEAMRDSQTWLGVSLHNLDDFDSIDSAIREFYNNDFEEVTASENRDAGNIGADWFYKKNYLEYAGIWTQDTFYNSAIKSFDPSGIRLYNSDPTKAHENCTMRRFKNYHFIEGKIYKCGPAALFPKLDDQFGIHLSDEDREILNSYQPLTIEMAREGLTEEWFNHIDDEIPQCKFCPETYDWVQQISTDDLYKKIRKK